MAIQYLRRSTSGGRQDVEPAVLVEDSVRRGEAEGDLMIAEVVHGEMLHDARAGVQVL